MTFGRYVRSCWPQVSIMAFAILMCNIMLNTTAASGELVLLVTITLLLCGALALVVDYRRRRPFLSRLIECAEDVEHPLWITEMVAEPDYLEGQIAFDALRVVAKAANDDVALARRQTLDYREYVETWVHEAKSPLAAAHLMLDNLAEAAAVSGAEVSGEVLVAKTEALGEELGRVEGFIEQALYFARSESLDRDYLICSYGLRALVTEAVKANARLLIGAHVVPVLGDLDRVVFTDEKWMAFILGQLIQNSVKYAPLEGGQIEFSSRLVDEGLARERIELAVRDNGCGVSAADLPRVFDRGFTGANGRQAKRSTGIGLYLVQRLCAKMGLEVAASSEDGMGFCVTIAFATNKMHYFEA